MCINPAWADKTLEGSLKLAPPVLSLESKGVITAFIQPPDGYSARDIDVESIKLEGIIEAERSRIKKEFVKAIFVRDDIVSLIDATDTDMFFNVELTMTGKLNDNSIFTASETILVINPDSDKADAVDEEEEEEVEEEEEEVEVEEEEVEEEEECLNNCDEQFNDCKDDCDDCEDDCKDGCLAGCDEQFDECKDECEDDGEEEEETLFL